MGKEENMKNVKKRIIEKMRKKEKRRKKEKKSNEASMGCTLETGREAHKKKVPEPPTKRKNQKETENEK